MNGRLESEQAYRNSFPHGWTIAYQADGQPKLLSWMAYGHESGIYIQWQGGTMENVEKRWIGRPVERLLLDGGAPAIVDVMHGRERDAFLASRSHGVDHLRRERIDVLFEEATHRLRGGTLFDDPLIFTDENGDPSTRSRATR